MRISFTCLLIVFSLCTWNLGAQSSKDATVPMTATVNLVDNTILLEWANPDTADLLILRRTKGQAGNQWIQLLNDTASTLTSGTDNFMITQGETYEYVIQRFKNIYSYGYAHVAVRAPVVDKRGEVLVIVDSVTADILGVELVRMKNDMRGDGWVATPIKIGPSATVQSVKSIIQDAYNADPQNVKAVLLVGDVPIPYSGNANWDGHNDHAGAWPADSYYADLDGVWTDNTVDNTTPSRAANDNVPGDGKFDQSFIPGLVEVQVGRIDFRRIDANMFGEDDVYGLIRRYLDKNHAWRTGAYTVENKALVDDNFGYFNGEAFASNGYRNAYPLVGEANVVAADFFNNTNPQTWLLGYGCGGGTYTSASGVGNSTNFATDTVNIVFANLFGSYHGDWDYESNPFMPSALASRGGILTCSWAGRPHWFNQALASGETIGYCHMETQNAQFNNGFIPNFAESGAHTALLGDPTLRAHIVPPPSDLVISNNCAEVDLNWTASAGNVEGYHIYRSLSNDGPYERITSSLVAGTSYTDMSPLDDTLFYQVRAIKTQITPGGGIYINNSVGPIAYVIHNPPVAPLVDIDGSSLTCVDLTVTLSATSDKPLVAWSWNGPSGTSNDPTFEIDLAGNYSLTVTDEDNCMATGSIFIEQNTIPPILAINTSNLLTCSETSATLSISTSANLDGDSYMWSNGETTAEIMVSQPGTYTVTAVNSDNGCMGTGSFNLQQDIAAPPLNVPTELSYSCLVACASLELPDLQDVDYYLDQVLQDPSVIVKLCNAGIYELIAVGANNGCTSSASIEVIADVNEPGASAGVSGILSCQNPTVQLMGSTSGSNVSFYWAGPGIVNNPNQQNPLVNMPGVYTVTVEDLDNGCSSQDEVTVEADISLPQVQATGGVITCNEVSVELMVMTNSAGASFSWTGPMGFSSTEQNPVTTFPGTYTVVVSSIAGCTNSATVQVEDQAQVPEFGIPVIDEINCDNPCVTVQLIPITPGLQIDPVMYCDPGTYTITVTSNNGCSADATFLVMKADTFTAMLEPGFIDCDGTITLSVVAEGGTMPYSYLWSNGSTFSGALFVLDGSPISVTVSDSGGCVWESDTLNIVAPPPLNLSADVTDASGMTQSDGSVMLNLSGGTPPFGFIWSNGSTNQNLTGVLPGTYTVIVTELTTGCTAEGSFVVGFTSDVTEIASIQSLDISPNPSSGVSVLNLVLREQMPVKIQIHDAIGRLIADKPELETNTLTLPLDLSNQAPGVYYISIGLENEKIVRKLVIQR
ncbi:MAG: T9SS type A sorting domain-containing protein [Lewinellaceae bacterium]|nr:T9SS type A sorting domain-containing protein [Lewinellaceae bacterium]